MASQLADNSHFSKLLELKQRIEFLRNDVDPDILIGAIERELSQSFEFQCTFNKNKYYSGWNYHIRVPNIQHSENFNYRSTTRTKLDALYEALEDLTRTF